MYVDVIVQLLCHTVHSGNLHGTHIVSHVYASMRYAAQRHNPPGTWCERRLLVPGSCRGRLSESRGTSFSHKKVTRGSVLGPVLCSPKNRIFAFVSKSKFSMHFGLFFDIRGAGAGRRRNYFVMSRAPFRLSEFAS